MQQCLRTGLLCLCIFVFDLYATNIRISTENLSEDKSSISSKNDELYVLLAPMNDSTILFSKYIVFDKQNSSIEFDLNLDSSKSYKIIIYELDSESEFELLNNKFLCCFGLLSQYYDHNDYKALSKEIGDDDIIAAKSFELLDAIQKFEFMGYRIGDLYQYKIEIRH